MMGTSFRMARSTRPQGRNCAPGNLEIPGSMLRIAPEMTASLRNPSGYAGLGEDRIESLDHLRYLGTRHVQRRHEA